MSNFEGNWTPPPPPSESVGAGEYARFWRRLAAHILDQVSLLVIVIPMALVGYAISNSTARFVWALFTAVASSWVLAKWWHERGGSPWRARFGILVLDSSSGAFLTMESAMQRALFVNVLGSLSTYVTGLALVVLLDYLWMLWDSRNQTLHDKLARSIVVDRR